MVPLLTRMQQSYVNILKNPAHSLVVCTGPAGTGKTLFACRTALEQLKDRTVGQIVITKPLVSVEGEDLGFLPGNMRAKMSPWIESYLDIFKEYYPMNQLEDMIKKETIKLAPLAYCRGNTYSNSFVICDESQNTTPRQMKMLLTRLGERSKMVIVGDTTQIDLKSKKDSGMYFLSKQVAGSVKGVAAITLKTNHRHPIVESVLNMYKELRDL